MHTHASGQPNQNIPFFSQTCYHVLRIGKGDGRLWMQWWMIRFHKIQRISWLAASFWGSTVLHVVSWCHHVVIYKYCFGFWGRTWTRCLKVWWRYVIKVTCIVDTSHYLVFIIQNNVSKTFAALSTVTEAVWTISLLSYHSWNSILS